MLWLAVACVGVFGDQQGAPIALADAARIPRHVYLTYWDPNRVPQHVHDALARHAENYTVHWYDNQDCERYMKAHADAHTQRVYASLQRGAHRADLWRYQILYDRGGVYLDADVKPTARLDAVFQPPTAAHTVISMGGDAIFQAILATPPRNPLLLQLLRQARHLSSAWQDYDTYTHQMYDALQAELGSVMADVTYDGWRLMQERCVAGHDKYGLHCEVWQRGRPVFVSRVDDYPY